MATMTDGDLGYITLDKPPANSYDKDFMDEFGVAVESAASDAAAKVIIVRSASKKFFCAGADIKAFMANDTPANLAMIELAASLKLLLYVSVIACIFFPFGFGGGYAIALLCYLLKLAVAGVLLGVFEMSIAKMRVFRVPNFLGAALMLSLLGVLLLFVSGGM